MNINGTDLRLFVEDKSDSSALMLIGASKTCGLTITSDSLDGTNKSVVGWKANKASKSGWEITTQILLSNDDDTYTLSDLIGAVGLTELSVAFGYNGGYYSGDAVISKLSLAANDNELTTVDITLMGEGALTFASTTPTEVTAALSAATEVPMSSILLGSDFCLTTDGSNIIGSPRSFSLDIEADSTELASKKNGAWKEYSFNRKSFTVNGEVVVDSTEDYASNVLFAAQGNRGTVNVKARVLNETRDEAVVGSTTIDGVMVVTNLSYTAQDNELATYSFSGTGTGSLTVGTVAAS